MKAKTNILFTSNSSDYTHQYWDSSPLFFYYKRIDNYLKSRFGDELSHFYALPDFTKEGDNFNIVWRSKISSNEFKKLSDLTGEEYTYYRDIFECHINKIQSLIDELKSENKEDSWAKILEKSLIAEGESAIYCFDDKVCIAPWAMTQGEPRQIASFSRKVEPPLVTDFQEDNIQDSSQEENKNNLTDNPSPKEDNLIDENQEKIEKDFESEKVEKQYENNSKVSDNKRKKWKKWLLWLLAILLLLLLLYLFLPKACLAKSIKLPKNPNVISEIDSSDIALSEDSVRYIAVGRINILFKNKDVNFEQFSKDLSKKFADKEISIVYYDTIIKRIQLEVPKESRLEIKKELPIKLPSYDMVIFDESVIGQNKVPNDKVFQEPEHSWFFEPIQAINAWDITTGNDDLLVVVIDGGFDLSHEDFQGKDMKGFNVVDKSNNVLGEQNMTMHGTHVTGIVGGVMSNGKGSTGISPKSKTIVMKVSNGKVMTITSIVDAVLYAIHNKADVVNLSLGMSFGPLMQLMPEALQYSFIKNQLKEEEYLWNEVFKMANENNTTIILAGGNEGLMIGLDPMQRTPYTINVSSVDQSLKRSSFSNYGNMSTISAPGESIYSTVPGNKYMTLDGTSMAAPIVTGGVVLIKSVYPKLNNNEIKNLIQNTGLPLSTDKTIGPLLQLENALKRGEKQEDIQTPYTPPLKDKPKKKDSVTYNNPIAEYPPIYNRDSVKFSPPVSKDEPKDCKIIKRKIDSLQWLIDYYKKQCGYEKVKEDTLKMPDDMNNKDFLLGRWRSSTTILNDSREEVVLYFDFTRNGDDQLTLVEPNGMLCKARLQTNISSDKLSINQMKAAQCQNNEKYSPYLFNCWAKSNGTAQCKAQNKELIVNNFEFNLIRVK